MLAVYISTAKILSSAEKEMIEAKLKRKFSGKDLDFSYHEDASLLAGLRMTIDSDLYDGSLKAKLEQVAKTLK